MLTTESLIMMQAELKDLTQTPNGWPRLPLAQRFAQRVILTGEGCWGWSGASDHLGYSRLCGRARTTYAHRLAYELMVGPIPDGMEIDHICRNRGCVNPSHLRVCTHSENLRNTGRMVTNTSGFKGVSWHKASRKWTARITLHQKGITLGYFNTPEDAYACYCKAAKELHGEFVNVGSHLDELDLRKACPPSLVGGRGPKVSPSLKKTTAVTR